MEGKDKITITDRADELYNYCKELSTKLFNNYGLYKIESDSNIFEIFMVEDINNTTNNNKKFINSNYNYNSDDEEFYQDNSEDEEPLYPISNDR